MLSGRLAIKKNEIPIPRMGTSGTSGVLNGRGKSGRRTRNTHTPAQTITKASSVPIEVSWLRTLIGRTLANSATQNPTTIDEIHGVRNLG